MTILTDNDRWLKAVRNIITFRYLTDVELEVLVKSGTIQEYTGEEPIVTEGEIDQGIFGILQGTVSVNVQENDGADVFICSLGPGEVFGEAGFFLKIKRTASVVAKDKVTVFRLDREALMAHIRQFPSAGNKILLITIYGLLRKLRAANQELAYERKSDMNQGDIDDIVAGLLCDGALS